MTKKLTRILIPVLLFAFVAGGWSLLLAGEGREEGTVGPEGLIRLHIIANSDSAADQQLKYQVRDAVTAYLAPLLAGAASVDDARHIIASHRTELLGIARQTAAAGGTSYPVAIETGWFDFPVRSYGTLVLPSGRYESVRILLGAAEGKNWWCVLFPPLCFIEGTTAIAAPVAGATGRTVPAQPGKIEIRWKILELGHRFSSAWE